MKHEAAQSLGGAGAPAGVHETRRTEEASDGRAQELGFALHIEAPLRSFKHGYYSGVSATQMAA